MWHRIKYIVKSYLIHMLGGFLMVDLPLDLRSEWMRRMAVYTMDRDTSNLFVKGFVLKEDAEKWVGSSGSN